MPCSTKFEDSHFMQVSHTLLSLVDSKSGQPFSDSQTRLWILTRMLQSALAQSFNGMTPMKVSHELPILASKGINSISALNICISCSLRIEALKEVDKFSLY